MISLHYGFTFGPGSHTRAGTPRPRGPAVEPEPVHSLRLPRWRKESGPNADEHHVVHDRRARRDLPSEVELPEQGTRPGIERPQLTRAVAHEVHTACDPGGSEAKNIALRRRTLPRDGTVRGVEGEDVRWPGEGSGVDLPERDARRRTESAGDRSRHHRLLPDGSAGVAIDGIVDAVLAPDPDQGPGRRAAGYGEQVGRCDEIEVAEIPARDR